jgi:hypothetical protein
MPDNSNPQKVQKIVLAILTVALLAWGSFHAIGAYFGGFGEENLQHDFRRSLVVLGCMAVFLGFWWVLILTRKPRNSEPIDNPERRT